ncbi:phage tail sheath C-terminal domain-containing protein [Apilactobacillus xinyiensis]|uniref:phage tail sheath C-terminal domain-containing protein n=1 Tax=Apilactobacillus xinyiensis TaxID=2841032 RepID=UPI00200C60DE|nr:phage tail sheath C-terminal domain-containing protein [Apilactobacillus xinyiensis]MCL0330612.1 phage tail sheath family protein [Apilactobacillus xinyiensis]
MAGGTWKLQDKVRPGAYINTVGKPAPKDDSSRGIVLLMDGAKHDWGANGIIELNAGSDFKALLGADLDDDSNKALKETVKFAQKVLYVNLNDGDKATLDIESVPWKFTAKYAGEKGNDITIDCIKNLDGNTYTVKYIYGTEITSTQKIQHANELMGDDFVDVQLKEDAESKLANVSGENATKLTGGTTKDLSDKVTDILSNALETSIFDVATTAGYPVESNIHSLLAQLVSDLRDKEGYHVTAVIPVLPSDNYNSESVSAVMNGVILNDGTTVERTYAAGFFAGASASIPFNQSLTYAEYPDAVDTIPQLSNDLIIQALKAGKVVFTNRRDGTVVIEQDINSLTKFTNTKPKYFAKNRIIRELDYIANYVKDMFEGSFIGKISNNVAGRDLFKAEVAKFLSRLQDMGCIENYVADDIEIERGKDKDAVMVNLAVQPVDSMEKLYMTITAS